MKKLIIGTLASLCVMSASVQASDDSCNFQFDHDLSVIDNQITLSDSAITIEIDSSNQLFINNEPQSLTAEQQEILDAYADNIRLLIPEVSAIAMEGVSLGIDAASLALGSLLGQGDPDYLEFMQKIQELADNIMLKLDLENFDSKRIESSFDAEFENEIETLVEETIEDLTPRLMAKVMTAAMMDGGVENAMELQAEQLEMDIENMIEPRAEALEARAHELCAIVTEIDTLENQLVASGFEQMDLIRADTEGKNHSFELKGLEKLKEMKNYKIIN